MASRSLRPPSRPRDGADSLADRHRRVLVHAPRRGPLPEGRFPHRRRHDGAAWGVARADRNGDHRQDRGSGQHHQRDRRAALGLVRGRLNRVRRLPSRQERRCRGAGSARQGQRRASAVAAIHRSAARREIRPGRGSGPEHRRHGKEAGARGHGVRGQDLCGANWRASPASARCSSSAAGSARSTSGSMPIACAPTT